MTKALQGVIGKYGAETVIARLMEQIRVLSECDDIRDEVARTVRQYTSDIEYIYDICEYTNLVTYASDNPRLSNENWDNEDAKKELEEYAGIRKAKSTPNEAGRYLLPSQD